MSVSGSVHFAFVSQLPSETAVAFHFFFFQAEDGIRDDLVTGVQTCALPILAIAGHEDVGGVEVAVDQSGGLDRLEPARAVAGDEERLLGSEGFAALLEQPRERSEERRVGKECRSRWSPYH